MIRALSGHVRAVPRLQGLLAVRRYGLQPKPVVAAKEPAEVVAEVGKTYAWCSCGRSKKQPLCDGSHKGTDFKPLRYKCEDATYNLWFCQCKQTTTPPFCDGTHAALP